MSASTVASGLTPDDRVLLRSVFTWARGSGWRGSRFGSGRRWDDAAGDNEVVWWYDAEDRDAWTLLTNVVPSEVCVRSVRQAVDVLVALGILPAHLSSSWLAGRESALDGGEIQWGIRVHGFVRTGIREDYHRQEVARQRELGHAADLVTRRCTAWERVPDVQP